MDEGMFGEGRDGDKAVLDWLIAATDDEELILAHYDSLDTEVVERILSIFKRVNRITEKEAHQKKMTGAATMESPSAAPSQ